MVDAKLHAQLTSLPSLKPQQVGCGRGRGVRRELRGEAARHADQRAGDGGLRHEGQVHHPQAQEGPQLQAHGRRGVGSTPTTEPTTP